MLIQDIIPPEKLKNITRKEIINAKSYMEKQSRRLHPFARFSIFLTVLFIFVLNLPYVLGGMGTVCVTPTISPSPGAYSSSVQVTLSTTTTGATICYTVDGTSTPTSSAAGTCSGGATFTYTAPFTITTTTTIRAIATKSGNSDSAVSSNWTYTVNIPSSSDATLSNLTVSSGTLSPAFSSGTALYNGDVGNNISSITVTPTANESHATIAVNGTAVASGNASQDIPMGMGGNNIDIVVTAQDGVSTQTYTITVNRKGPSHSVGVSGGGMFIF